MAKEKNIIKIQRYLKNIKKNSKFWNPWKINLKTIFYILNLQAKEIMQFYY